MSNDKDTRRKFIKKLGKLTEADFGLLRMQFPEADGQIDSIGAIKHRAGQLVNWAESASGPGIKELISEAQDLWTETLGSLSHVEMAAIVEQFSNPLLSDPQSEITDAAFRSLVDKTIDAVRKGEISKYEVFAKLNRALPQRAIAAMQRKPLVQKIDACIRLEQKDEDQYQYLDDEDEEEEGGWDEDGDGDGDGDGGGPAVSGARTLALPSDLDITDEDELSHEINSVQIDVVPFDLDTIDEDVSAMRGVGLEGTAVKLIPMLISVSDENWDLADIPGLVVVTRMGSVIGAKGTPRSLEALNVDPRVMSVEASTPQVDRRVECVNSMPYIHAAEARAISRYNGTDENGDQALVGIIDAGIDIFHRCFQKPDGTTRILAIWDQSDPAGPPPPGFEGAGGTLYKAAEIDLMLADGPGAHGMKHPRRFQNCHGTHVASIAAGSQISTGFPGGVASAAGLLVVVTGRSEFESDMPNSLGYSLSHVAALSWLDQFANQLPGSPPLAVNISMGQNSGAHDGSSPLELACDEFTGGGRRSGRAIVKSAGNMRDRRSHASLELSPGQGETLTWRNEPGVAPRNVRLDAWFPSHVQLTFRLNSPDGDSLGPVDWANPDVSKTLFSGNRARLIYTRLHPDNGSSRLVMEIQSGTEAALAGGDWTLDLVSRGGVTNIRMDCWVDALDRTAVQFQNHADESRTLSVPGTARSVITVGAIRTGAPIRVGDFSGYGPTRDRREKPELVAPGVAISAACSLTENQLRQESGTSMAAPHVTGAIALCYSACRRQHRPVPNAAQVVQAMMNSAQSFTGTHNPGRGFGDLNVAGLLATFVPTASPPSSIA